MGDLGCGTPAGFAALRGALEQAGYTEAAIAARSGFASIFDYRTKPPAHALPDPADALDVLIRLFLDSRPLPWETVRAHLPAEVFEGAGLLAGHPREESLCYAPVLLYPVAGLWIASDGAKSLVPGESGLRSDAVFPALSPQTRRFLACLPVTPCEDFLDLCSGTGVAALVAARDYAKRAWAADITPRAAMFADFNAQLNGLKNVGVVMGDLYGAVRGQTFDRIVAHPPYVPALERTHVFRDGGEDGEQITRGILGGVADHLRPGGRLYLVAAGTDRKSGSLETRVREMLGPRHADFDLCIAAQEAFNPVEYFFQMAVNGPEPIENVPKRKESFERLGVERLVLGAMLIERHRTEAAPVTGRWQAGPVLQPSDLEWMLAQSRWSAGPADADLWELRPAPHRELKLRITNELREGRWVTAECRLEIRAEAVVRIKAPSWTGLFASAADGTRTVRTLFGALVEAKVLPEGGEAGYLGVVRQLVGSGVFSVPRG